MSTVLEKPVLLDETGQEIVDKLDEIKSAISSGGEYIPLAIRVTTPPTKTSYSAGDSLDLSGIVVSLVGSNGSLIDITAACTFSPANGATLSTSDTNISITYHYEKDNVDFTTSQPITIKELSSISVSTPPTKTNYYIGETLDLTGIVVTALYSDNSTKIVTNYCTYSPADGTTLTASDSIVNISYTEGGTTKTATQSISVMAQIYGAEWDGTASSVWSRTDAAADFVNPEAQISDGNGGWRYGSSPFDDIMPWSGMVVVDDDQAGKLVAIPKFYYKWTKNGANLKLQICMDQADGFLCSPAHADRGDGQGERDTVYIGRYLCANSNYKSTSGTTPKDASNMGISTMRSGIHNLGSDIWQWDYRMYWTVMMLYLVEYANWNTQSKVGAGDSKYSAKINTGATDGMTYHTGTVAQAYVTYDSIQYRHIEDLWSNLFNLVDGIYFNSNAIGARIINNPNDFGDTSKGVYIGNFARAASGCLKEFTPSDVTGYEFALLPTDTNSTSGYSLSEYICDYYEGNQINDTLSIGGSFLEKSLNSGGFHYERTSGGWGGAHGCRLMKLPANS